MLKSDGQERQRVVRLAAVRESRILRVGLSITVIRPKEDSPGRLWSPPRPNLSVVALKPPEPGQPAPSRNLPPSSGQTCASSGKASGSRDERSSPRLWWGPDGTSRKRCPSETACPHVAHTEHLRRCGSPAMPLLGDDPMRAVGCASGLSSSQSRKISGWAHGQLDVDGQDFTAASHHHRHRCTDRGLLQHPHHGPQVFHWPTSHL